LSNSQSPRVGILPLRVQNGKYAKAIKTFESILSDLLEKLGEEHHRVGAALHNVAVANLRAGLLDDARDAIEEAVRIRKLTLGFDDPKVAVSFVVRRLESLS
jgi:tetratricopeptide (TPR) repeat protein